MGNEGVEADGGSRVGHAQVAVEAEEEEEEEAATEGEEVVSLEPWVSCHQGPVAVAAPRLHRALNVKRVEDCCKGRRRNFHGLPQVTWSRWRNLPS